MALTEGAFPYDINNLLGGAVRVVLAPYDADDLPAKPSDVFEQVTPYGLEDPFVDLGATKDAFSYGRSIDVGGYEIQQIQGNVIEEITNVTRTISVSMAEIGPDGMKIIEQAADPTTVAAVTGSSAYDALAFGSISDLQRYIAVFIGRRSVASGTVVEGAGGSVKRGRFVLGCGYNVAISADNVELQQGKGDLAAATVTFKFFPEPSKPEGEEYGTWWFERAGTLAIV